jgi:hypothetical protein
LEAARGVGAEREAIAKISARKNRSTFTLGATLAPSHLSERQCR